MSVLFVLAGMVLAVVDIVLLIWGALTKRGWATSRHDCGQVSEA